MNLQLHSGSPLDTLLFDAFKSYRGGLRRQPRVRLPIQAGDFETLKSLGTIGWVSPAARLELRRLYRACAQGLTAARQDRLVDAASHNDQAVVHLNHLERMTRLAWLLGVSTYQAGAAYFDFRCGRTEKALERIERTMDADLELEQIGLPVMQMHRIQQGQNLSRIHLRQDQRRDSFQLAGLLVAYMEGKIQELPYHRDWRARSLQAVPRTLRQAMIHQVIGESAMFIVTGRGAGDEWRVLATHSRIAQDPKSALLPQVQYALRAEYARITGNTEDYLLNLGRFFHLGIRDCHGLWYALMIEMADFCREANTHFTRQVLNVILADSVKWKGCPPFLRDRLNRSAAQRSAA